MASKTKHKLVIGRWNKDNTIFESIREQPAEDMTQVKDIVAWATETFGADNIGEFSFIKVVPGALIIGTQMCFDFLEEK